MADAHRRGWPKHRDVVVPPDEELAFQISVGLFQRFCPGHAQTLDQTIPGRLKVAFHASQSLEEILVVSSGLEYCLVVNP